jgi:hypothetical protein
MTPPEGMALVMPPPRAVYLGANMSSEHRQRILRILAPRKIPVFRMTTGSNSGVLVPVAVPVDRDAADHGVPADGDSPPHVCRE